MNIRHFCFIDSEQNTTDIEDQAYTLLLEYMQSRTDMQVSNHKLSSINSKYFCLELSIEA